MTSGENRRAILWLAGVGWDETLGTDRRIVEEIARIRPVVWMDPPNKSAWPGWGRGAPPAVEDLGGVVRVRVPAIPGVTRWPTNLAASALRSASITRVRRRFRPGSIVVANPLARFPRGTDLTKILYVTDDWSAGAPLMSLSTRRVTRILRDNIRAANGLAVISPPLLAYAETARSIDLIPSIILPNGAPQTESIPTSDREPVAGVIGQLNERLDIRALEAVADRGVRLRIVGPRVARDADFNRSLDELLRHPQVDWHGRVPAAEIPHHLAQVTVGLTPYVDSDFNRASSPLKTMEYLAAGLPVVSSDLPASRWLNTAHVVVTSSPAEFAAAAHTAVERGWDAREAEQRRRLASSHSWSRRAEALVELIEKAGRGRPVTGRACARATALIQGRRLG